MLTEKEQKVLDETSERNNIRFEIKQKKRTLAKMVRHADLLGETLILKAEIEALEKELEQL